MLLIFFLPEGVLGYFLELSKKRGRTALQEDH